MGRWNEGGNVMLYGFGVGAIVRTCATKGDGILVGLITEQRDWNGDHAYIVMPVTENHPSTGTSLVAKGDYGMGVLRSES